MNIKSSHDRRTIRYQGYDYSSPGAYFFTICALNHLSLFGDISNIKDAITSMRLNPCGKIVQETWHDLVNHIAGIRLDSFQIMPNHVHGIVIILGDELIQKPRTEFGEIIRQLKTFSARRINNFTDTPGGQVWQRNYYERVIRDEEELEKFRNYIMDNPRRWAEDSEKI